MSRSWSIFIHDPDGDMGEGVLMGTFESIASAEAAVRIINKIVPHVECIILDQLPTAFPMEGIKARFSEEPSRWT